MLSRCREVGLIVAFLAALAFSGSAEAAEFDNVEGWWNSFGDDCRRMNDAVNAHDRDIRARGPNSGYCVMYDELGETEKSNVDGAAMEIGGEHASIHAWWETLDCRKMDIATGGRPPRPGSPPGCRHFVNAPKYDGMNGLDSPHEEVVAIAGYALATGMTAEFDHIMMSDLWDPFPLPELEGNFSMVGGWWDSLDCPRMNAAVKEYDPDIMARGMGSRYCKMYADLRDPEKTVVHGAAMEIGGDYASIHLWWEALDCRKMSIAVGYAQPRYCGHFVNSPKDNGMNRLSTAQEDVVAKAGYALATGMTADVDEIMMSDLWDPFPLPALEGNFSMVGGWWDSLDCPRMNAAVNEYDPDIMASGMGSGYCAMYADLRDPEKTVVREAAMEIDGDYASIHLWWEALDCRKMSIAVGYAQPRYCGHFVNSPKDNGMNRLSTAQEDVVAKAGYALATGMTADVDEIMMSDLWDPFPLPALEGNFSMVGGWWDGLDCDRMNTAVNEYDSSIMASGMNSGYCAMYADLRDPEKTVVREAAMEIDGEYPSIHMWWEALDCRQMSIAVGYAQPRYCGHFVNAPKANEMNTLTEDQEEVVAVAGYALATGMTATFEAIKASPLWQPFTAVPALPLAGLGILGLLLAARGTWLRRRA